MKTTHGIILCYPDTDLFACGSDMTQGAQDTQKPNTAHIFQPFEVLTQ